jgi:hypothetical protein
MRQGLAGLAIVAAIVFAGGHTFAESADPAAPKCRKAEINPATGHALCIDPIGAPVDPPPAAELPPCEPNERSNEAWSYGPKCRPSGPGT